MTEPRWGVYVSINATDWLDRRVYGCDGEVIGLVVGVYDDSSTGRPAWIAVGMGAFSLRTAVVPFAGALSWGTDVVVAHGRETVLAAPPVDFVVSLVPEDEARLLEHYAHGPTGFASPRPPTESST
jgi:hypothetical protein